MFADALARLAGDEVASPGRLVHVERIAAREARFGTLAHPLSPQLRDRLGDRELWSHQVEALDLIRAGHNVAVATGTASGKSLCYQLPIGEAILESPRSTALVISPTKALAQDQLRALTALAIPGLVAATYDGDTSPEARSFVRNRANVLFTNPEMLHASLLPYHGRWASFFGRLQYVVIDELHVLRGVFGSHVSHLLRRLRRICNHYGSSPVFVFASATIGSPAALATDLCGLPVMAIDDDGSPRGKRTVALFEPGQFDERGEWTFGSPNEATAWATAVLIGQGHRTIAFCRSRRGTETVAAAVRKRLPLHAGENRVRAYRGGYLANERREIEQALFSGELDGVVATTALELGIDVGGLDACVINGFPGTIASFRQQAGRAGRRGTESLTVLVAGLDQLDRWLLAHPEQLFVRAPEPAVINSENAFILEPHLACAAHEMPLTTDDAAYWGPIFDDAVMQLVIDDRLVMRNGRAVWAGRGNPGHGMGMRSGSSVEVSIVDDGGSLIGTVDATRALTLVHPGAIYLHQGVTFRVDDLDLAERTATVSACDDDEYTQARSDTHLRLLSTEQSCRVGRVELHLGRVEITDHVIGYQRKDTTTRAVISNEPLDLPPTTLVTRAFWYTVPQDVLAEVAEIDPDLPGALHAAEHAMIGMLPLFTICDRWDVGGVSTEFQADAGAATIAIYDAYPGGAGIAELGFEAANRHVHTTLELLQACACDDGCPSCIQSPKCGNLNEPLSKAGAIALLQSMLGPARR
jgi:DEAD/DEAH box helicase domain-containing protein